MEYEKIYGRVKKEIEKNNENESITIINNYTKALFDAPTDLIPVIEAWIEGKENDFEFQGITLKLIQNKENCSYFHSLLRMKILMTNPNLAAGYKNWSQIYK